jgi:D-alanyl-D-alanine carboxypeptidase
MYREGELLWSACAGRVRLPAQGDPGAGSEAEHVAWDDRFVIASVTKLVVSCVALSLAERGELDLDQAIERWLPELPNADRITIRMLLSHGSGLREYFKDSWIREQMKDNPLQHWSRIEVIDAIARLGAEAQPGERFAYRNSNYLAVGEILELSTGKTIGQLVEEYVSLPLDLETLSFTEEHPGAGSRAQPYVWRPRRLADPLQRTGGRIPSDAMGEVWTDGGIAASAEDLAALTDALFGGRLLQASSVEEMSTLPGYGESTFIRLLRVALPRTADIGYGLGMTIEERGDRRLLGHNGMYLGWSAVTTFDTRSRLTVTVLTNLLGVPVPAERLEKKLRASLA